MLLKSSESLVLGNGMSFMWDELKRRHVVKVGLAYVAVGWLLIEIASTLLPMFKARHGFSRPSRLSLSWVSRLP